MKTTMKAALALVLLAGSAGAALAQDQGGHRGGRDGGGADGGGRPDGGQGRGGPNGGERPQFQDTERRDSMGGADNRGQRRSDFQADQFRGAPPQARGAPPAPPAPVAQQAPMAQPAPQPGRQFRGSDGQNPVRANRDVAGRQQDAARQRENDRRGGGVPPVVYDGRRQDGDRNSGVNNDRRGGAPAVVYGGRRPDGDRNSGFNDNNRRDYDRRDNDRRDYDRRAGDRNGWDRRDDRGPPHWQQGRYPPVYRSQQRYRYGYYNPPVGFYARSWAYGEFLPRAWWAPDYLLNDWWSFGLPYPPLGFEWVRVGGDALLIDSYSGRVVQVVRDIFW